MAKRAACIIGWPVKHSRSPKLHGYWLKKYNIDGEYRHEEVRPEDFAAFIGSLSERGYAGANVTLPHKEQALRLTEPDARAKAVGASNTLWYEGGRLKSTNTDVEGFTGSIDATASGWDKRASSAVVIGAGGAGRAIVYGLIERGIKEIHLVNRTLDKAVAFREEFGASIHPAPWGDIPKLLKGARLVVNTTSLGMKGYPELEIDLAPMAADGVVADIVYIPLKTGILRQAKARGLRTSNGLDMLLYQAVRGFELWFGVRPQVTAEQREMLVRDIEGG